MSRYFFLSTDHQVKAMKPSFYNLSNRIPGRDRILFTMFRLTGLNYLLYAKIYIAKLIRGIIFIMNKDVIDDLQNDWSVQRPDLNSEPMGVILRIQALAKIFGDQTASRLQEFDLQWWQYDVLSSLRRQGKPFIMAATELADSNMLSSGAMTNRIDRLEEGDLVRRIKDKNDGRRVLVQLTNDGLKLIEKATEARFKTATDALDSLNYRERSYLSNLLRLVLNNQNV